MTGRGDAELVRAVLDGERSAYRLLVERHEDSVFRRALGILGDRDLAADVVQDSFVRAYERLADCSEPDRFGGWLYRMVRNRCFDELRAARRRGRPLSTATAVASEDDPEDDLERSDLRRVLGQALDELSPTLREAFVLKHVDGLSYEEMQRSTGAAASALKMRVKRAREALEAALRPRLEDVTRDAAPSSTGVETVRPSRRGRV